ncbi:MAG: T9SS type A sorting domain-containing protein, partial [Bacteroidota bacterium]
ANSEISATVIQFKNGTGLKATNIFESDAIYEVFGFKADSIVQTGIEESSENSNVQIIFSQVNELIHITFAELQTARIELLNMNGKEIKTIPSASQISSISTSGIPSGAYFVRIKIGDRVLYKKIIIAR